ASNRRIAGRRHKTRRELMNAEQARIPVEISSRLLSEQVRYDGGHKKHSHTKHILCAYLEFKGLCPEP
ncbi:MAG: hypothetical protein VXY98_04930, partial [Pseudomonadota bacterium]|nr:hypothetical protein [Pseudomonadota bacterium]